MLDSAPTGMEANSEPPRPVTALLPSEVSDWKPSPARETVNEFGVNTAEPVSVLVTETEPELVKNASTVTPTAAPKINPPDTENPGQLMMGVAFIRKFTGAGLQTRVIDEGKAAVAPQDRSMSKQ